MEDFNYLIFVAILQTAVDNIYLRINNIYENF